MVWRGEIVAQQMQGMGSRGLVPSAKIIISQMLTSALTQQA